MNQRTSFTAAISDDILTIGRVKKIGNCRAEANFSRPGTNNVAISFEAGTQARLKYDI